MKTVSVNDVREAYIKIKSNIYYDRSDLLRRKQLAVFETNLDSKRTLFNGVYDYNKDFWEIFRTVSVNEKFEIIAEALNTYSEGGKVFFDQLLKDISAIYLPKTVSKDEPEKPNNFITNQRISEKYKIERATAYIDLPLELEIIICLWILRHAWKLDQELEPCSYGNRLILNKSKTAVIQGSGLFKPYFKQYHKWYEDSVGEARRLLSQQKSIAFLNLDFKDYFYSVRIDTKHLDGAIFGPEYQHDDAIHEIVKSIHREFTSELRKANYPSKITHSGTNNSEVLLPIGLLSSYILGNWYLKEFDNQIKQKIRPAFYGRYVDDIIIVFENPNFTFRDISSCEKTQFDFNKYKNDNKALSISFTFEDLNIIERFILETFYPILRIKDSPFAKNFKKDSKNAEDRVFELSCNEGVLTQSDKTLLYFFDSNESIAALDKLKQDIQERSSEFRDFPEDEDVEIDFDSRAYELIFDGTHGKIRTLKDYKENRYGLSVFLANRIFSALRRENPQNRKEGEKILKFFKGLNAIEYHKLWEKIFTYFVVNNNRKGFVTFYKNVTAEILKLFTLSNSKVGSSKIDYDAVCEGLLLHLNLSFEMALSLNRYFLETELTSLRDLEFFQNAKSNEVAFITKFKKLSKSGDRHLRRFIQANILRHDYVIHPLFNYAFSSESAPKFNFVDHNLNLGKLTLEISDNQKALSPRKVKFYECCLYSVYEELLNMSSIKRVVGNYSYPPLWLKKFEHYLDESFKLYRDINKNHDSPAISGEIDTKSSIYRMSILQGEKHNGEVVGNLGKDLEVGEIWVNRNKQTKFRIGFANTVVKEENIESSINKVPKNTKRRFKTLSKTLKDARVNKVEILLFPECYLPYELLPSIAKFSAKNQIAVVVGLEHWNVCDAAFNFIVTILPFEAGGVKDALVHYRLKNHYSHAEESLIRGYGYKVPKPKPMHYNIFNWKGLYFAPFYCFELADIQHRSFFRSKLDLLIASEWNRDVNYFSSIIDSLTRDIHAYVAQVNTSNFGDSRLSQPKESAVKDLLKLKGGKNEALLVGEIDVQKLRKFQMKGYELGQKDKNGFKPTPPDFDREYVRKRFNNERLSTD